MASEIFQKITKKSIVIIFAGLLVNLAHGLWTLIPTSNPATNSYTSILFSMLFKGWPKGTPWSSLQHVGCGDPGATHNEAGSQSLKHFLGSSLNPLRLPVDPTQEHLHESPCKIQERSSLRGTKWNWQQMSLLPISPSPPPPWHRCRQGIKLLVKQLVHAKPGSAGQGPCSHSSVTHQTRPSSAALPGIFLSLSSPFFFFFLRALNP